MALFATVPGLSCSFSNLLTMKLRNRQKHASDNIEQEDYKLNLTSINASSSTVDEPNTCDHNIKQEDVKNQNNLLKQNGKETGFSVMNILQLCTSRLQTNSKEKSITTTVIYASRKCPASNL